SPTKLIYPNPFLNNEISPSLSSARNKWFVNLSSTFIPNDVQSFLQFDKNFALSNRIFDCIKSIEYSTQKLSIDKRIDITNHSIPFYIILYHSIPILNNLVSFLLFTTTKLLKLETVTKNFSKLNSDIIFTYTDKGNVTVNINSEFYQNNLTLIINILIGNDYPLKFIFDTINVRMLGNTETYVKNLINMGTDGCRVCSLWIISDRVTISKQYLEMFQRNPDEFLCRFITVDETWIHYAPMAKFNEFRYELLPHPAYSPDLDYFLFPNLKKWFGEKRFITREQLIAETEAYFERLDKSYYSDGLKKQNRWIKCIKLKGDCVEK
ncbi:SETMR methyltransferase, partial [Acromyrmex charruanus]